MSRHLFRDPRRGLAVVVLALAPTAALAEGSDELDGTNVHKDTQLFIDVFEADREVIVWSGEGKLLVDGPNGAYLGSFSSGTTIDLTDGDGAYALSFTTEQTGDWDISIYADNAFQDGRLHSYEWFLNSETYGQQGAFDGSVYFLVPTGDHDETAVIEMRAEGLTGWEWTIGVNGTGVEGADGRSVPSNTYDFEPAYAVYLNPPEVAVYQLEDPLVAELSVEFPETDCDGVVAGHVEGQFRFKMDTAGQYHLTCDLDGDGDFDVSSDGDLTISGEAVAGENTVSWDGLDNGGEPVAAGTYLCQVLATIGEVHYVAEDIETAWPGFRLFELASDGQRTPLSMYWNDAAVQANAVTMPDGQTSLESSGGSGMSSGNYGAETSANDNARAWGDFSEESKGNLALLDTYTWLESSSSGTVTVTVIDPEENDCWEPEDTGPVDTGPVDTGPAVTSGYYRGGCSAVPVGVGLAGLVLAAAGALLARRRED